MEKKITVEKAYERMARLCSRKECCASDIRQRLSRMELSDKAMESIILKLKQEQYIDEERFIQSFINDKLRFNKWGRKKIEAALLQKQLPREMIDNSFSDYPEEALYSSLPDLLKKKWRSVKGNTPYEKKAKLVRYALSKGFSMREIDKCLNDLPLSERENET